MMTISVKVPAALAAGVLVLATCLSTKNHERISVTIPTVHQEATSIWRTINDIKFFQQQGYTVALPEDEVIDALITKSQRGEFGNEDFTVIYELLEEKIYRAEAYVQASEKVLAEQDLLEQAISELERKSSAWEWPFKVYNQYSIVFTRYGSGGSYNPENGNITLLTNEEGRFKKYDNPAHTIIHEIVHLGMEASIVQRFELSHQSKERLVDQVVVLLFGDLLTTYQVQEMGEVEQKFIPQNEHELRRLPALLSSH